MNSTLSTITSDRHAGQMLGKILKRINEEWFTIEFIASLSCEDSFGQNPEYFLKRVCDVIALHDYQLLSDSQEDDIENSSDSELPNHGRRFAGEQDLVEMLSTFMEYADTVPKDIFEDQDRYVAFSLGFTAEVIGLKSLQGRPVTTEVYSS